MLAFLNSVRGKIRTLELKYINISDACVEAIGEQLADVTAIKLYGTKISTAGSERIRKLLPAVDLDFRKGGFLGVGCQTHVMGCLIAQVQSNTAASRAGLQPGDVIVRYDGKPVANFEALTQLISQNAVDEKVHIEVVRNVQTGEVGADYRQDGKLGVTGETHAFGFKVKTIAKESPLAGAPFERNRNAAPPRPNPFSPFPAGSLRPGDVIFRIGGNPLEKGQTADQAYQKACESLWQSAYERAKKRLTDEGKLAEAAIEAKARKDADVESLTDQISVQFARGGEVVAKDVPLGAWD